MNIKQRMKFIEKCYKLYENKLYNAAYGILRDVQLSEDAVQDTFLKLMEKEIYFENASSDVCKKYLIKCIKNSAINVYNKRKLEQERAFLSDDEVMGNISSEQSVEDEVAEKYDNDALKYAITRLPEKYRKVIKFLVIENMSVRETAYMLDISESAVRKRYERGKIMLKERYLGKEVSFNE